MTLFVTQTVLKRLKRIIFQHISAYNDIGEHVEKSSAILYGICTGLTPGLMEAADYYVKME